MVLLIISFIVAAILIKYFGGSRMDKEDYLFGGALTAAVISMVGGVVGFLFLCSQAGGIRAAYKDDIKNYPVINVRASSFDRSLRPDTLILNNEDSIDNMSYVSIDDVVLSETGESYLEIHRKEFCRSDFRGTALWVFAFSGDINYKRTLYLKEEDYAKYKMAFTD